ncbi:LysR family transcriptional regulator [Ancylobacter sp. MQZ15Z-1]|uniref:LysR family transcriptional regulator n=1 Tax=Ancylobacter mangrovi TaxID=2972472 RepID=A0A9X2T6T5_9HYPH|nr:LysR family transcriptional regulator [Ancylobacter mangrovi]MCS0495308.1 LysR family transcriptional regulator [Ancylobacter mangrovi]
MQNLSIFVRVVEAGSFTAGARSIGTTPSAVSKSMARLERRLGARLFLRSTRAFGLTPEGEAYFERIAPLIHAIEEAGDVLGPDAGASGRLRISVPADFGRVLVDALTTRFRSEYPGITLDLSMSDRQVDLVREGYDAVVRVGRLADSGLIARPLGSLPMALVAAPAYLALRGTPGSIAALSQHDHIRYLLNGRPFPIRFESGEQIVPDGVFDTDSGEAMRIAARNGLGIAQLLRASVSEELSSGELVTVLTDHPLPAVPVQILHAFARATPGRANALFRFLEAETARWQ